MKKWYQSWTVWFNLGLLTVATINELSQIIPISSDFLANVAIIGNIILRLKTTTELYLTDK